MRLTELNIGDHGVVSSISAKGEIRRRLLDMGLCKGTKFQVIRKAPLGDPIVLKIKGFDLSLRLEEAHTVTVELQADHTAPETEESISSRLQPQKGLKTAPKEGTNIKVALMGNPNSGKTSLFNALVGAHQHVGNFSGVTVEKFEGTVQFGDYKIDVIDLPGTYSLTAYSPEEVVARNYILEEKPDLVIHVVDGTNLERNLYLTTQLMELEVDLLVALNMYDQVEKENIKIDFAQLEQLLGSHVIPVSASLKSGLDSLLAHIISGYKGEISIVKNKLAFSAEIEEHIQDLASILESDPVLKERYNSTWLAVKLLENDQLVYEIVKNRAVWIKVEPLLYSAMARNHKRGQSDPEIAIIEDRHSFVRGAVKETVEYPKNPKRSLTDKIDALLLNRFLGLPIFFGVMWLLFQVTFTLGEYPMTLLELLFDSLSGYASEVLPEGLWRSLIADGIISGVGGVLVFIPNILILFAGIAFLEGTGYMARSAFVIDKVMHRFGLHGKSFIPLISGFGCSVPAIMACRTLKNRGDRLTTMMIIPFMSCGAKLPVYILLLGAFFKSSMAGNLLFGIYMFGVVIALISARILKKALFNNESEPFVMELPPYRMPGLRYLLYQTGFRAKMYLKKAGTIILAASVLIWIASNFPKDPHAEAKLQSVEITNSEEIESSQMAVRSYQLEYSIAGRFGKLIEPVLKPLGFDWKIGVALTAGMAAKEIIVSTLQTIFALTEENSSSEDFARLSGYSQRTALSLMIFVLLYVPCIAAVAVFQKEAGKKRWTAIMFSYTIVVAWLVSFGVYQISGLFL